MLVKNNDKYGIFTHMEFDSPGYYSKFSGVYRPLKDGFWGLSGQLQLNEKEDGSFTLSTSLAYMGEQFDDEKEAIEYFNNITEPNFSGFFEDVFGDG